METLGLDLDGWQVAVVGIILLGLWAVTNAIANWHLPALGQAGSIEQHEGRQAVRRGRFNMATLLALVLLVLGGYVWLRQPTLPRVSMQVSVPTATPIVEGRLRPGLHVEVVAPRLVPMYAPDALGRPTETVVLVAGNGLVGVINGGPNECGGAICWRVQLVHGQIGWLVERLPEGARVLAAVP